MPNKLIDNIKKKLAFRTSEGALNWYRSKGVKIGEGTLIHRPSTVTIDISRPELIRIGENVLLHKGLTLMAHDYASRVFLNLYSDFIPSHGHIIIGNNVWFGQNCTVLKGVTIGDNSIIGYGSTVLHDIPANSVAAGTPAKVICTLEQYYEKRKRQFVLEAVDYYKCIKASNKNPQASDFFDDYPVFVDGRNYDKYNFPYSKVFRKKEQFEAWILNHKAPFASFEEFAKYAEQYE